MLKYAPDQETSLPAQPLFERVQVKIERCGLPLIQKMEKDRRVG